MRIPLHVISGFLGSGKTTAILSFLRRRAGREKIAVLVNDFGAVDIDGAKLAAEMGNGVTVVDVPGGCICCTAGVNLYEGLYRLLETVKPDRIIIEPTGLARPADVVDLLRESDLADQLEMRPVITLINPRRQFRPPLSKIPIPGQQAETADVLVANFADQAGDDDLEKFYSWAGGFYPPKLKVLVTKFGELPDEAFEWPASPDRQGGVRTMSEVRSPASGVGKEESETRSEGSGGNAEKTALPKSPDHPITRSPDSKIGDRSALEHHDHQADGITRAAGKAGFLGRAWCWPAATIFYKDRLEAFFKRLYAGEATGVVRAKGVFHTVGGWLGVEVAGSGGAAAGATLEFSASQHRRDSRLDIILYHQPPEAFEALDRELQEMKKM